MTTENQIEEQDPWHDDVLERKALGRILEDHLINRFSAGNHAPLSLALDGRWGTGKTFFVERWTKQLISNGRFVISFNAWQHDGAPEPSLALIGELRRQLQELSQHVISQKATSEAIEAKIKTTIASAKKAIKPMLIVAASGFLKRTIGSSLSDFSAALSEDDQEPIADSDTKILDKALDTYLDQMLSDYELHQASISKFRDDLASLARSISDARTLDNEPIGPVIIIIDELDRCRPNFAVQLLEGIKHLFSVDNVCFVFATNLAQLTASIQVVYGANFSGREYLGRFFDRELTLPSLSESSFSKLLCQRPLPENISMGRYRIDGPDLDDPKAEYWLALSRAMGLTLRQQEQAFAIFQTSCQAYPLRIPLPGAWLMFLTQLKSAKPDIFSKIHWMPRGESNTKEFRALLSSMNWEVKLISNSLPYPSSQEAPKHLISLLTDYFKYSKMSRNPARIELQKDSSTFSEGIDEYLFSFKPGSPTTVLESTFEVVSTAGMFSY